MGVERTRRRKPASLHVAAGRHVRIRESRRRAERRRFYHVDDVHRRLNRLHGEGHASGVPCGDRNRRIIRGAEIHAVSHHVKHSVLHLTALLTVSEHAEPLIRGLHVHGRQLGERPRLHRELPLVAPPAVDRRDTIHDKTADGELRIGGDLREMDWGYGKLFCKPDAQPQIMMALYQSAKKVHGAVWMHQYRRNVSGVADSGHDRVFA